VKLKKGDTRYKKYVEKYGLNKGWEVDALPPETLRGLVRKSIEENIDFNINALRKEEQEIRDSFLGR
jgi:hypothetical protein